MQHDLAGQGGVKPQIHSKMMEAGAVPQNRLLVIPEGMDKVTFDKAVEAVVRWEDQGEFCRDLVVELYNIFRGKSGR